MFLHNTFVHWGDLPPLGGAHGQLLSISRNNLWIWLNDGQIWWWIGTPDWRTDLDYDGFDLGEFHSALFFHDATTDHPPRPRELQRRHRPGGERDPDHPPDLHSDHGRSGGSRR